MSNSPLNHKKRGGILGSAGILGAAAGLFGGRKRKRNSNPNDPNTLNKLQNLSQKGGIHGQMAQLALQQQGGSDAMSVANNMQQEALASAENTEVNPIDIQKEQVAQASGLSALTQGPATGGTTLADQDYNRLLGGLGPGTAFAMKSPLKQGSYENPEQIVDVDTSAADAINAVGNAAANAVSKTGNNNNEDKKNKDEE